MTMTNAEWCIRHGIKFKNLKCECYLHSSQDSIGCYDSDGIYHEFYKGKALGDLISESILTWLDMEHVELILDDAERRYLSAVIKPFRDDVQYIVKYGGKFSSRAYEEIAVRYQDKMCGDTYTFILPRFEKCTMYKGMEVNRHYTLEELGL